MIYDRYSAALYGIALRIVKDEALAKDVVQESLIKIWKNGEKYNPEKGSLFNWMLNIVRRTQIDKTRSPNFRANDKIQSIQPLVSDEKWSDQLNTNTIGLRDIVNKLDEKYRLIIELLYFQGYSQSEISKKWDMPLGTVKTRTRIALRELRKIFKL